MNYRLSKHASDVISDRDIKEIWIKYTLDNPSLKIVKASNEVIFFATIEIHEGRCLKVVLNPMSMVVVTAYFDRNMRKKGCK
ncbi:MAG: DUF4258 domain-containing protein [Campylobacterota bacterium]|nr:DUF4258 domain-containing protein [Campylobacterota bacterium]